MLGSGKNVIVVHFLQKKIEEIVVILICYTYGWVKRRECEKKLLELVRPGAEQLKS